MRKLSRNINQNQPFSLGYWSSEGFFFFFWGVGFNSRDFPLVYFFPTRSLESPSFLFPHFTAIFFLFFWGGAISEFVFALVQKLERK